MTSLPLYTGNATAAHGFDDPQLANMTTERTKINVTETSAGPILIVSTTTYNDGTSIDTSTRDSFKYLLLGRPTAMSERP